ncbi:MAG: hypothetical protein K6U80_07395 [Firmicutes bacterium]|nr:hypothetical protein [Bacillota bacterium]
MKQLALLRVSFELRYPRFNVAEHSQMILDLFKDRRFDSINILNNELYLKNDSAEQMEVIVGTRRLLFIMHACPNREYFIQVLKTDLAKAFSVIKVPEISWIEVRGCHLYPIGVLEEFFELVTALNEYNKMEFNDTGVSLHYSAAPNLNVNILFRHLTQEQARKYFHLPPDQLEGSKMYLGVDMDIWLNEILNTQLLEQLTAFLNQTNRHMDQKLESILRLKPV